MLFADFPKVSIVMPVFNQVRFVEKSILSVLEQDYMNIELIVIDGGSTDGSLEVIERHAHRIAHLSSEKDNGQSDALNKGFACATGEIFGWLNSDDLYAKGAIRLAVEAFISNPKKSIVYGDWTTIDEFDTVIQREYSFPVDLNHLKYEGVMLNAQSMFWRREVHEAFGGFDVDLYNTMDYEMVLVFAMKYPPGAFMRLPQILGSFRRYVGQKTGRNNFERQLGEHEMLSVKFGYTDKYRLSGRVKRYVYRVRRGYWYYRHAGLSYFLRKSFRSQEFNRLFSMNKQKLL